ncbi:MAG TPA: secretin and TonB N-terminal domain-containing protein, partial [Candidatus Omnitrophota bacterium]|nr:secretin and TonB N-terminal domain-containing protein [Candidatus Omnitrophota bacterium]
MTTPEVFGLVTVDLENVDWKTAFKVILKMYDLGYVQDGNIITVSSLSKLQEDQKKEDEALFASGGMKIEAFKLKHVEAADVAKMVQPFLSKEGKVSVLDVVNKQGWG